MADELAKTYDATAVQAEVAAVWDEENCFHAEPGDPGEPYAVVIPPPNVTGALHLGHALNNTIQDTLVRRARMQGKNAVWLPGTDHAGIATQAVVDKRLQAEGQMSLKDYKKLEAEGGNGREQFIEKVQAWKDEYEAKILGQLKAMGCSCDFDRTAFTMDEQRARGVREAFFQLFKDGLIYRGKRLVNWDPATQTALADDEVEMEEIDGHFYYLKYAVEDPHSMGFQPISQRPDGLEAHATAYVTVATTRPETMLGDTAVAINPKDPRAAELRGKFVRLPIVNRLIPIIEDDYVVLPVAHGGDPSDVKAQFATGFLKVTPAHDPNDWDIGQRHGLPVINVMAPDGTISRDHGWPAEEWDSQARRHEGTEARREEANDAEQFLGLDRYEARRAIVEWFRQHDLLEEVKPYRHSVGHSYRSHVPIEPYLSDQWYVATKQQIPWLPDAGLIEGTDVPVHSLAGLALDALSQGRSMGVPPISQQPDGRDGHATDTQGLQLIPERYEKTYRQWHENIRDWCISRQLWWGHRIPVWTDVDGRQTVEPTADAVQDPDVLDTWFSSALWPMSTLGWPDDTEALAKWNPTAVLCTAREIITLWVGRMVMFNRYFLAKRDAEGSRDQGIEGSKDIPATDTTPGPVPFLDVFVHAMIQDGEGRKMSKSLGNGVDPLDIIHSHGADAMRFTLAQMTTQTQDVRMPVVRDPDTGRNTSPRFDNGRNFCNKLWNASRFVIGNLDARSMGFQPISRESDGQDAHATVVDRWILSRLARTVQQATEALDQYRFDRYANACYDFFWRDFCDWYVEASKPALKDPARAAATRSILATCLDVSLRLMQPMIPFVTERLWWALNDAAAERGTSAFPCPPAKRCIRAAWPDAAAAAGAVDETAEAVFTRLQEIVVAIRQVRNENKVEPRKTVTVDIHCNARMSNELRGGFTVIELLANCSVRAIGPGVAEPDGSAKTTAAGATLYVEGVIDVVSAEKRRGELERAIKTLQGRLANAGYIAKAPPHLVEQTKQQLADAEAELSRL